MDSIWDELREVQHKYHVRGSDSVALRPARADRRTHPRYVTPGLRGTIWHAEREIGVDVIDISLSGTSICGELAHIKEETDVVLTLHIDPERPIVTACEVMRSDEGYLGLRYLALDPAFGEKVARRKDTSIGRP